MARSASHHAGVSDGTTEHTTLEQPAAPVRSMDSSSSRSSSVVARPLVTRHDSSSSPPLKRPNSAGGLLLSILNS